MFKRCQLKKEVKMCTGGMPPRGYGIAYQNYMTGIITCYPLGINLIVGLAYYGWIWLKCGVPSTGWLAWIDSAKYAHDQGYAAGRHEGMREGYERGYTAALDDDFSPRRKVRTGPMKEWWSKS